MKQYIPCPHCGSMNREADAVCYQCGKPMARSSVEAESPGRPADSAPIPPSQETRIPRTEFAVQKTDRDSTVVHGLRSGAIAGAISGLLCGLFCSFFGSMLSSAAIESMAGIGLVGVVVFFIVLISNVIYGAIIGAILGGMNVLCYQADCIKFGAIAGVVLGVIFLLLGWSSFMGLLSEAAHGSMIGYLASYVERRIFRKQYAEL